MKKYILCLLLFTSVNLNAQERRVITFDGGLNTRMSSNQLPDNQASVIENLLVDEKPGALVTPKGYSTIFSTTQANEIFEYRKNSGQTYLIKHYQGSVHSSSDNGVTWTLLISGLKWEVNPLRGVYFDDYFVMTNGLDDVIVFDGVSAGQYDFIPKGKYLMPHYNRLFVLNTIEDNDRLYYNVLGSDITDEDSWKALNYEVVDGRITGVASYRDQLVIFTENGMWALLGGNPATWRIVKINTNYGCVQHETIAMDKGLLKFLSRQGIKAYDGSGVYDIDFQIQNDVLDAGNLIGEYNYLTYNNSRDFVVESSTGIDTSLNEIKLNEFEVEWDNTGLNGTLTDITYYNASLYLSTTTSSALTTYTRAGDYEEWTVSPDYNLMSNIDDGDASSPAIPFDTSWRTSVLTMTSNSYIPARKVQNLSVKADFNLKTFINTVIKFDLPAGATLRSGALRVWITADLYAFYKDGITPDRIATDIFCSELYSEAINEEFLGERRHYFGKESTKTETVTVNFPIPQTSNREISSFKIVFKLNGTKYYALDHYWFTNSYWTGLNQSDLPKLTLVSDNDATLAYRYSIGNIYEAEMKYTATSSEYETSGTVFLSTKTVDTTNTSTVVFGSMTVYGNWDSETTNVHFQTASSTDNINFGAWTAVSLDTTTLSTDGYALGQVDSIAGKYLAVKSSFTTSVSTQTPIVTGVYVDAVTQSGSVLLDYSRIGKNTGGWSYFIASGNDEGTKAYYVGFSTYSTVVLSTTAISSGDLLTGTTLQDYIQYRIDLTAGTNGTNPIVYSLTSMYIPVQAPVYASAISIQDRYHLALSTAGTANTLLYIHDKNSQWTQFNIAVRHFTVYGKDTYFSNATGIYKMYDGTTFAGNPINSRYEKVIVGDYSLDHRPIEIITTGQKTTAGALDVAYKASNSTITYTASNIDSGASTGRFRHRQPSGALKSATNDWTVIYTSTSPVEINRLEMWLEVLPEFRR